jgi:2-(1,2-epoxy-1,2-dihydrophenyl)acetyl-CoA isomerase
MAKGSVERGVDEAVAQLRGRTVEVSRLFHEIPQPTIAMVNGPAAGAGMALALACDLRIAALSARFVTAFANIGFSGDFGGSYFLSKLVGSCKARELYYTAKPLDATHALALGVVNRVVPDAELVNATMQIARNWRTVRASPSL